MLNKKYVFIYILLSLFIWLQLFSDNNFISLDLEKYKSINQWDYLSIDEQVGKDSQVVPFGKGAIFIPAMSDPLSEGQVLVFQENDFIVEAKTGEKIVVPPGKYTVMFGVGGFNQLVKREVEVKELKVSVLNPDWSGLKIKIKNLQNNYLEENYEVYDYITKTSFGVFKTSNEDLGQIVLNLILEPGYYKIVKSGEKFDTSKNFITVFLLPGMLHKYTIYMNEGNFIGAGIVEEEITSKTKFKYIKFGSDLNGDITFNQSYNSSTNSKYTFLSGSLLSENRFAIDYKKHHLLINTNLEEGQSLEEKQLRKYKDKLDGKIIYIYRLFNSVGPYLRADFSTNLLSTYQYFNDKRNIYLISDDRTSKDTLSVMAGIKKLKIAPSFYPLKYSLGYGLNIQIVNTFNFNILGNIGYASSETKYKNCYESVNDTTFKKIESSYTSGLDMSLTANLRFTKFGTTTLDCSLLLPFDKKQNKILEISSKMRFIITKNISLNYNLDIVKVSDILTYSHGLFLRFGTRLF